VLASTAVGLIIQLLTPWFKNPPEFVYLDYDGNRGTVTPNARMDLLRDKICRHHPAHETGDALFDVRDFNRLRASMAAKSNLMPAERRAIWASVARFFGLGRKDR
jgi:hypothetical protein